MPDSPSPSFNKAVFQEWKGSRVNQAFFQFLRDTSEALARKWASGEPMSQVQQAKAQLFLELADLEWSDVCALYGIEDDDGTGADRQD